MRCAWRFVSALSIEVIVNSHVAAVQYGALARRQNAQVATPVATTATSFVVSSSSKASSTTSSNVENPSATLSSAISSIGSTGPNPDTGVSMSTPVPALLSSTSISSSDISMFRSASTTISMAASPTFVGGLQGVGFNALPIQPVITPALAVSGVFLLLFGVIYALIGIKNKMLQIFISSSFLASLSVTVLIVYVMHPPASRALQGAYFVAAFVTGIIFGAGSLIFMDVTEGLGCLLGGYCLSMWFLSLRQGGLIQSSTGKSVFIAVLSVAIFALAFNCQTRPYGLIGATSFAGATAVALGIDCFSRAGLKEFWLYLWDLNNNIFPLHTDTYAITRGMRVELASIIVLFVVGIMSQMKIWSVVQQRRRSKEEQRVQHEQRRDDHEEYIGRKLEEGNSRERAQWELTYDGKQRAHAQLTDSGVDFEHTGSSSKYSSSLVEVRGVPTKADDDLEMDDIISHGTTNKPSPRADEQQTSQFTQETEGGANHNEQITPARGPRVIPLPFSVPLEQHREGNDVSSIAASVASNELHARQSTQNSGTSLFKCLSRRSFAQSLRSSSEEVLVASVANDEDESSRDNGRDEELEDQLNHADMPMAAANDGEQLSLAYDPITTMSQADELPENAVCRQSDPGQVPRNGDEILMAKTNSCDQHSKDDESLKDQVLYSTSEVVQSPSPGLEGRLPESQPKVVTTYRTNEWAKHLDDAERPHPDNLHAGIRPSQMDQVDEMPVPVHVGELQQTSANAQTVPAARSGSQSVTVRRSRNALTTGTSPMMSRELLAKTQHEMPTIEPSPPHSDPANVNKAQRNPSRTSLLESISPNGSTALLTSRCNSQKVLVPGLSGVRITSGHLSASPLVESPIEEGIEASFLPRMNTSPIPGKTLLAKRDTLIRSKHSSSSPLVSTPELRPSDSASVRSTASLDDENIPLSHRRSLLQQRKRQFSLPQTTAQLLLSSDDSSPRKRHRSSSALTESERRTLTLIDWRNSVPQDLSSSTHHKLTPPQQQQQQQQDSNLEARRAEMMSEKTRSRADSAQRARVREQRGSKIDLAMRRGEMLDLHREAMRRMQAGVNGK